MMKIYLIKTTKNLDQKFLAYYKPGERFNRVVLSKIYLSMFLNVDSKMKIKINNLIDQLISKIYLDKSWKNVSTEYF